VYRSSFGHQTAKLYDIADGYKSKKTVDEKKTVKLGLAITRHSVLKVIHLEFEAFVTTDHFSGPGRAVG